VWLVIGIPLGPAASARTWAQESGAERLWQAARTGAVAAVQAELDAGVDVNAATEYQSTALSFACDRGHAEVVKLLLERGANPNIKDKFYNATPLMWAQMGRHYEVITALLQAGAEGVDTLLLDSVSDGDKSLLEAVLKSGRAKPETVSRAAVLAAQQSPDLGALFEGLEYSKLEVPEL